MKTWATTSKIARITQAGHNGELDIELQDLARHLTVTTSQQGLVIINQKTRNKSKTNNAIVVRQKLIQKSAITRSGQEADSAGVNVLMFSSRVITFYG